MRVHGHNISGTAVLVAIALVCVGAVVVTILNKAVPGWFTSYNGFAGSMIGAIGTVYAGYLAFSVGQRDRAEERLQQNRRIAAGLQKLVFEVIDSTASADAFVAVVQIIARTKNLLEDEAVDELERVLVSPRLPSDTVDSEAYLAPIQLNVICAQMRQIASNIQIEDVKIREAMKDYGANKMSLDSCRKEIATRASDIHKYILELDIGCEMLRRNAVALSSSTEVTPSVAYLTENDVEVRATRAGIPMAELGEIHAWVLGLRVAKED